MTVDTMVVSPPLLLVAELSETLLPPLVDVGTPDEFGALLLTGTVVTVVLDPTDELNPQRLE